MRGDGPCYVLGSVLLTSSLGFPNVDRTPGNWQPVVGLRAVVPRGNSVGRYQFPGTRI